MHKLTTHLRIITIGLSIFLTISSCGLLLWDEPVEKHSINYINATQEIKTLVISTDSLTRAQFVVHEDSTILNPTTTYTQVNFVGDSDVLSTIREAVDYINSYVIKVYQADSLIKEWNGTPGYYGDSINSPFNYDSWEIVPVEDNPENIVGAVTFTITDEDLK